MAHELGAQRTWVLTGSPENFAATRAHGFRVIGFKERRRRQAEEIMPGDRIVLYFTKVMAFAAAVRVAGELYEDRTPIWPGKPGRADPYPWRFATEPELVLEEPEWVAAESLVDELEHVAKWPREHWKLALSRSDPRGQPPRRRCPARPAQQRGGGAHMTSGRPQGRA